MLTREVGMVSLDRAQPDPPRTARSSLLLLRLSLQHHPVHRPHRNLQPLLLLLKLLLLLLLLLLLMLLQLPRTLEVEAEELFQIPVRPLSSGLFGLFVAVAVLALLDAGGHVCCVLGLLCFGGQIPQRWTVDR